MTELIDELAEIEAKASAIFAEHNSEAIQSALAQLIELATEVERAHCGSWLGYHSLVYYENLEAPPPGAFFDVRWGLMDRHSNETVGRWCVCNYSQIYDLLKTAKTKPSFEKLGKMADAMAADLDEIREDLVSLIEACRVADADKYLEKMLDEANKARMTPPMKYAQAEAPPPPVMTNDLKAAAAHTQVPPHAGFKAYVKSIRSAFDSAGELAAIAKRTRTYLTRRMKAVAMLNDKKQGGRVFIGHGRSSAWMELKNYLQDRLDLKCDDFNREATAGRTTVARLQKMLDDSCFALLVLTAEDEQVDGKVHARQNVIHEAGLFQGRLGFEKAIVMLEDGCEEFSNIHGLGQIRFGQGKISASFHEVSDTLRREGIIA